MRRGVAQALLMSSALTAVLMTQAQAATVTWNNGAGTTDWTNATNWGGSAPGAADTAVINLGANGPNVVTTVTTVTNVEVGTTAANGTLNVSGGGVLSDTNGYLGFNAGSSGTVTVDGTGSNWIGTRLEVGSSGTGALNVTNGGKITTTQGRVGQNGGAIGITTIDGSGSLWANSSGDFYVGISGAGTLNVQNGAAVTNASSGYFGANVGATGTVTVTGTGSSWANTSNLTVGNSGTGVLTVSGGGIASNAIGYLGYSAGGIGTATVNGTGSSWTNSAELRVGSSGSGTLNVQNGGSVGSVNGYIAYGTGSNGTATVDGTGSDWTITGNIGVGRAGTGALTISNGGTVNNTTISIATLAGSVGTATVDGIGSQWITSDNAFIGSFGTGTLNVQNGGSISNVVGVIGSSSGATGTVTVTGSGSSWTNSSELRVGNDGTGTLTLADRGNVSIASGTGAVNVGRNTGSVGTLNIGSDALSTASTPGTLSASSVAFGAGTGSLVFNHTSSGYDFAPSITGSGTIRNIAGTTILSGDLSGFTGMANVTGGTLEYAYGTGSSVSAAFSGSGGFMLTSGGTTYLTGNSSAFSGATTVTDGSTLSVNGSLGGTLDVASGGTLKGNGTVGDVSAASGSVVAPGNSIGTLTAGSYTSASGSTYQAEIDTSGHSDLIHATGTATLNGGTVEAIPTGSGVFLPGMSYTILTADGGITGTFDSTTVGDGSLFLGSALSYDANNVTLSLTQAHDFDSVALTHNQATAARAAQSLGGGQAVFNQIIGMSDANVARSAFDRLSGEIHASAQSALLSSVQPVGDLLRGRLATIGDTGDATRPFAVAAATDNLTGMIPTGPHRGAWVQGFGNWSRFDGNSNSASLDSHSSGVLMGVDGDLGPDWQGGMAAGYSVTGLTDAGRTSTASSTNYHAALYAGMRPYTGQPVVRVGTSFTWHDVTSARQVSFGGFTDSDTAHYTAWTTESFADVSQPLWQHHDAALAPFGTLSWLHQSTGGFTEGGGASALHVDDGGSDLLSTTLGLRGNRRLTFPHRDIKQATLSGDAGWTHLIGDATPDSAARFASGGSDFTVIGTPLARDAFTYNAALSIDLDTNASLSIAYGGQLAAEAQTQSLTGQFRYAF